MAKKLDKPWNETPDGHEAAKELLLRSGTPLEIQVAHKCREFCRTYDGVEDIRVTTMRVVYPAGQLSGEGLERSADREVDQSVQFDTSMDFNDQIGVRLRLRIPFECKYRRGLTAIGFPRPRGERAAAFPMLSDFAGAVLVNQLAYQDPQLAGPSREYSVSLIAQDERDLKIHDEQLIYKAGASIYDFISNVELHDGTAGGIDRLIEHYGLVDALKHFSKSSRGDWFARFRRFVRTIPDELIDGFNNEWLRQNTGGQRLYIEASLHVPTICLNGLLFVAPCSSSGRIRSFIETDLIITGLRLSNWPNEHFSSQLRRRPEALAVVTNVKGIPDLLHKCFEWYTEMLNVLRASEAISVRRAILEGVLYRSAAQSTGSKMRS